MEVFVLPALNDNYIFVIRDESSNQTAVVDPAVAEVVTSFLDDKGWKLNLILNTHHHFDHVGGNEKLIKLYNCEVYASEYDANRIPGITKKLNEGSQFLFGREEVHVLDVKGHTLGHIAYFFKKSNILFCGDTLFAMGCGRLFEGSPEQMLQSLNKLSALPDDTVVYCAHEYTESNGRFALTLEPENKDLVKRMKEVVQKRKQGEFTIPTQIGIEKQTNPFLRSSSPQIRKSIQFSESKSELDVFTKVRQLKDHF